jgi:phospholipid/cholesterol/gamma-HCH transport system permease protein
VSAARPILVAEAVIHYRVRLEIVLAHRGARLRHSKHAETRAWYRAERRGRTLRLIIEGDWTIADAAQLDAALQGLSIGDAQDIEFDTAGLKHLDSAGAWLLLRTKRHLEHSGRRITGFELPTAYKPLFDTLEEDHTAPPVVIHHRHTLKHFVERVGHGFIHALQQGYAMLGYLGHVTIEIVETVGPQKQLRWPAFMHQIEETGITALPIVGLLSFLIGVVLAYQGADQLKRFGAEILTVDLVAVAVLREVGGLMTAIIVAGRSGSAFTAQIGTMKVNEEVDAMETLGLNTVDVLVLPRMIGLVVVLPLLTFFANIMGILGGAMMSYLDLGITFPAFLRELQSAVTVWTFWLGIIKAPVFAFIIALVGCFEGLKVEGNAASVGRLTTRSVVESIFLVIVFDAGFSILFSILGI